MPADEREPWREAGLDLRRPGWRSSRSDHGKCSHGNMERPILGKMSEDMPPQKPCPDCGGSGTVEWETPMGDAVTTQCSGCGGTGTVLA